MDSSAAPFISFVLVIQFTIGALIVTCLLLWVLWAAFFALWERWIHFRFGRQYHRELRNYIWRRHINEEGEASALRRVGPVEEAKNQTRPGSQ